MARRPPLLRLLLSLSWANTLMTCVGAQDSEDSQPVFIFPNYQYGGPLSEFYLEDTIIVTYINCDNRTYFACWCSDNISGTVAGDDIWKILEGKGYLGPNASQPIVLEKLGKDKDFVFTCGFSMYADDRGLPSWGLFRLQNKPRPGGPLTFGLDKTIAPTTTISNYKPFTTFAGDDTYKKFNTITGPIEAHFATLSSSTSRSATASTTSSPTATPQSTASTSSSAASPTSSEAGTNINAGQDSSAKKGGLSTGAIAGIGAGAAVLVIAIAVLAFLFFWRRRKSRLTAATAGNNSPGDGGEEQEKGAAYLKAELEDNSKPHGNELDGSKEAEIKDKPHELGPGTERYELGDRGEGGWQGRVELP